MAEPKRYRAEFIEPGLVGYTIDNRREMVLVQKEVLDRMLPSLLGKPVFDFVHRSDISPDQAFDMSEDEQYNRADGVISNVGYNEETAKYFADMMIWDDKTQENIDDNGFSVSCAYKSTEAGPGGRYNGVDYDEEVLDGYYHHMAIVSDPRYTASRIYENSNDGGNSMKIWRIGKKRENAEDPKPAEEPKENGLPVEPEKENVGEIPEDAMVEINGQMVPVSELVAAYSAKKKEPAAAPAENVLNMDDMVKVGEKDVAVKDLVENYCESMQNAEPPTDTPLEDPIKENSADSDPKHFKILQNAADRGAPAEKPQVNTMSARLDRGKNRYGSAVENGGK